jgi:hypothetical protein
VLSRPRPALIARLPARGLGDVGVRRSTPPSTAGLLIGRHVRFPVRATVHLVGFPVYRPGGAGELSTHKR